MANKWRKRARKLKIRFDVDRAWMRFWRKNSLRTGKALDELREQLRVLQESDLADLHEKEALLAWQRGVREMIPGSCVHETRTGLVVIGATDWANFCRAIEGDGKEET
jgi:hypothetical protein